MRVLGPSDPLRLDDDLVIEGDNAGVLPQLPEDAFDLIYVDPPFNTGRRQRHTRVRSELAEGASAGFGGRGYAQRVETRLEPGAAWPGSRLHMLSAAGGFEFIDGSRRARPRLLG